MKTIVSIRGRKSVRVEIPGSLTEKDRRALSQFVQDFVNNAHTERDRANTATPAPGDSREEPQQTKEFEDREDFGPNGDGTTPGFFKP